MRRFYKPVLIIICLILIPVLILANTSVEPEVSNYTPTENTLGYEVVATPSPTPRATETPRITNQATTQQQENLPKYNGTRTGRIIKYKEWCTGQEISIYENEQITKKASDGKTYTMTQGDWDCYEKYLASRLQQAYTTYTTPYSAPSFYGSDGLETAWLIKDIDSGDNVIIERSNGEQWLLEAQTWCSWCWLYEGRRVYLKFGYATSKLINDDGDVAEFWTEEEL